MRSLFKFPLKYQHVYACMYIWHEVYEGLLGGRKEKGGDKRGMVSYVQKLYKYMQMTGQQKGNIWQGGRAPGGPAGIQGTVGRCECEQHRLMLQ